MQPQDVSRFPYHSGMLSAQQVPSFINPSHDWLAAHKHVDLVRIVNPGLPWKDTCLDGPFPNSLIIHYRGGRLVKFVNVRFAFVQELLLV